MGVRLITLKNGDKVYDVTRIPAEEESEDENILDVENAIDEGNEIIIDENSSEIESKETISDDSTEEKSSVIIDEEVEEEVFDFLKDKE